MRGRGTTPTAASQRLACESTAALCRDWRRVWSVPVHALVSSSSPAMLSAFQCPLCSPLCVRRSLTHTLHRSHPAPNAPTPRLAADYIALANAKHTLALSGVPVFTANNRTSAYRFVTLVDVLYEHRWVERRWKGAGMMSSGRLQTLRVRVRVVFMCRGPWLPELSLLHTACPTNHLHATTHAHTHTHAHPSCPPPPASIPLSPLQGPLPVLRGSHAL